MDTRTKRRERRRSRVFNMLKSWGGGEGGKRGRKKEGEGILSKSKKRRIYKKRREVVPKIFNFRTEISDSFPLFSALVFRALKEEKEG